MFINFVQAPGAARYSEDHANRSMNDGNELRLPLQASEAQFPEDAISLLFSGS